MWLALLLACSSRAPQVLEGTLVAVDEAPVNCTITLDSGAGPEQHRAHYAWCREGDRDQRALIGKRVQVTLHMVNIQKESCAGKTNCMDLEEVRYADEIAAI